MVRVKVMHGVKMVVKTRDEKRGAPEILRTLIDKIKLMTSMHASLKTVTIDYSR